jgi:hypothetical protein
VTNKEKIVATILKARNSKYQPLFEPGDVILNKRDKIVRKVKDYVYGYDTTGQKLDHATHYLMTDIVNPLKNPRNMKYEVTKEIKAIDCYYQKLDPQSAQILYGISPEMTTKSTIKRSPL